MCGHGQNVPLTVTPVSPGASYGIIGCALRRQQQPGPLVTVFLACSRRNTVPESYRLALSPPFFYLRLAGRIQRRGEDSDRKPGALAGRQ